MFIFRIILSYRLSCVFHMFSSIHHSFVCIPRPPILDLDFLSSSHWSDPSNYCGQYIYIVGLRLNAIASIRHLDSILLVGRFWLIFEYFWRCLKLQPHVGLNHIKSHSHELHQSPPISCFYFLGQPPSVHLPDPSHPMGHPGLARHPQRCQTRRPGKGFEWIFHIWTVTPGIYIYNIHYIIYNVY